MITTCTHCNARYQLDGEKVPRRVIRVRCPDCRGVFQLDGSAPAVEPVPDRPLEGFVNGFEAPAVDPGFAEPSACEEPVAAVPSAPEPATVAESTSAPVEAAPAIAPSGRRRRSKEEMLARALVSDILVYNRDMRDAALAEGKLAEAMSGEIKKSWELYKEKVTPEVASSTDCFREALNEILAEGQKVF